MLLGMLLTSALKKKKQECLLTCWSSASTGQKQQEKLHFQKTSQFNWYKESIFNEGGSDLDTYQTDDFQFVSYVWQLLFYFFSFASVAVCTTLGQERGLGYIKSENCWKTTVVIF